MTPNEPFLSITDLSGGLNNTDTPVSLADNQAVTAQNVEYYQSPMPRKRGGCENISLTSWSPTGIISGLFRFVPNSDESAAEFWAIALTPASIGRLAAGTTWASVAPSPVDVPTGNVSNSTAVGFNNKLFFTYRTGTTDRMHVWDGTTLRRVGLATSAAATVADQGSGSYTATLRYYKVSYRVKSGSDILRQSEPSASVSFTPSGSGVSARVTQPTPPGEGETHWVVWGSSDDANYYQLSEIVIGTTTYDDSAAPSSYSSGTLAPDTGDYTPPTAVKLAVVHENRLLLMGSWQTAANNSRIYFTPILGSTGIGDDERVPSDNYFDLDNGLGGAVTAAVVFNGSPYVFKQSYMYKLVRTGVSDAPYIPVLVSDHVGCMRNPCLVTGEDETGGPALYWMSRRGPYRYGERGLEYIGRNIEATWDGVALDATRAPHGVYYIKKKQVWWWISTGVDNDADELLIYHVRNGAWTHAPSSKLTRARCSCLFAGTPAATMPLANKPYLGAVTAASTAGIIRRCDTGTADDGTAFQALVKTKPYPLAGLMVNSGVTETQLYAEATAATTLRVSLVADYGLETRTGDVSIAAASSETRVCRKVEDLVITSAQVVQIQVGDASAVSSAWALDAVVVRTRGEQVR